jgi:hypothetical protein
MGETKDTTGKGLLENECFAAQIISVREEISENWGRWRKNKKYCSNEVEWWVMAVKQQIRKLFKGVGS